MRCDFSHTTAFVHVATTARNIHFSLLCPCTSDHSPGKPTPEAGIQSLLKLSHTSTFLPGFITSITLYDGWTPPNPEFINKKLCIYSYTFKLQSSSKYSPSDAIHLSRLLSHCSKQFLNSSILMPFSASAVFCFTSSTSAKHFPLRTLFSPGETTKILWGQDQVNREGGAPGSCYFGSKTDEHSLRCGWVHS